jgi:hypothetical protein
MKKQSGQSGFSLVEVLAIAVVVVIIGLLFLRPAGHEKPKATRIKCVNNLKNVGLAFRIFATDNNDRFPVEVLLTNGVPRASIDALRVFLTLSNEFSTPKILHCPEDKKREEAESFTNLTLKNLSYFVSLSAEEKMVQAFLAGDRNLQTNGVSVGPGLVAVTRETELSWSKELHNEQGNVVLGDGSVQTFSSTRLKQGVRDQGAELNYLAVP